MAARAGADRPLSDTWPPPMAACGPDVGDLWDEDEGTEMKVESVLSPGIYRMDNGSYRVIARVGDRRTGPRPKEKRFPAGTALRPMKRWQEDQRAELRREELRPVRGTLVADMPRYLLQTRHQLEHPKHRESELNAWLPRLAHRRRDSIETNELEEQVEVDPGSWTVS